MADTAAGTATSERMIIVTCGVILLVTTFDFMGLAIAMADMARDLEVTQTDVQWALSAYLLSYASSLIVAGRFADLFGHRRIALCGLATFAGASLIVGTAPTLPLLLTGRILQGVGGAMLTPAALAIVRSSVRSERIGPAIGAVTAISTIGVAIGPLVGGAVTDLLGWRWIFFMNLPTAALAIALTLRFAREDEPRSEADHAAADIDWPGLAAIVIGMASIALLIDFGEEWGWLQPSSLALAAVGLGALAGFVAIERRSPHPLIDLGVFRVPAFTSIMVIGAAANLSMAMPVPVFAIFTRTIREMDPFEAGLLLLPFSIAGVIAGPVVGRLFRRTGARWPLALSVGLAGIGLLLFNPGEQLVAWLPLMGLLALMGFGSNGSYSTTNMGTQAALPKELAGQASGTVLTGLVLAAAIGTNLTSELMEVQGEGVAAVEGTTSAGGLLALLVAGVALVLVPRAIPRPR